MPIRGAGQKRQTEGNKVRIRNYDSGKLESKWSKENYKVLTQWYRYQFSLSDQWIQYHRPVAHLMKIENMKDLSNNNDKASEQNSNVMVDREISQVKRSNI